MRLKLIVKGKVQGVFFRKNTRIAAKALNLTGYVKNKEDGSVLIEIQGSKELLDQFMDWCKVGPKRARVDEIIKTQIEEKLDSEFIIK
jgi:acylphosphatase